MGYDSRLYIVEKSSIFEEDIGKFYAQPVAMFDSCVCYPVSNVLRNESETDCYFYGTDGNTKILEDKYGEPLTETALKTVIDILEEEVENGETYRRIFPLLSMLKTFNEQLENGMWKDLVVLHYGY